ncbi:MAG: polysaccharide biosynthesis/export family protein [Verrucomicrobia bacterium]|nr:polysaccharide biosynthesis/export family protein [Verrucomicrobiota bacterium]
MKPILLSIFGLLFSQFLSVAEPKEGDNEKIAIGKRYELRIKNVPADDMKRWNRQYEVDRNGCVRLPLIGETAISGLSLDEAAAKIRDTLLNRKIFTRPEIELFQPKILENLMNLRKRGPVEPKKGEHVVPPNGP